MTVLMLLLGLSVAIIAIAGMVFIWAVDNGQFEELDRHAFDVLDDPLAEPVDHSAERPTARN